MTEDNLEGFLKFRYVPDKPNLLIWSWLGTNIKVDAVMFYWFIQWTDPIKRIGWFGPYFIEVLSEEVETETFVIHQIPFST